ncbi:hypothetical protein GU926_02535 [Nibribacter ruber]|uniref:Peptidase M14 domain-containing protein n=1 Tax=Nibribacter ruber TaxID=2698458 RepID=A0A6P1NVU0_9BACT|nr:M14 family metallopeptidase [Nibribacter ruber]QHL86379.1 hypothetical protein GU926_02535 [Nibribacter ruber]
MKRLCKSLLALLSFISLASPSIAQKEVSNITAPLESSNGSENLPLDWKRSLDYEAITAQCKKLARTYPDLVQLESIGESASGRRIWALTISYSKTGNEHQKPAYFVEGSTLYETELGPEHAMYLMWHLVKNFGTDKEITRLLEEKTFYVVPISFPDARAKKVAQVSKESATILDDDQDGRYNEDGPDDLNQDGVIAYMRRKSSTGPYVLDQKNPLKMVLALEGSQGTFEWLGLEGFDNDRDGQLNEDPLGYTAHDQDWGWNWKPSYGARQSSAYPFSIPEHRALKEFILRHPNIAGAQVQYRSTDQLMFQLRHADYAAAPEVILSSRQDEEVLLDHVLRSRKWNWLKMARGLHTFPVHILQSIDRPILASLGEGAEAVGPDSLATEASYHPWTPFEHPMLGAIEIGGLQVEPNNLPEGEELEKDLEQFVRQTIANAQQLPRLEVKEIERRLLPDGLTEITATIHNTGLGTHSLEDVTNKVERPDYITLREAVVLASALLSPLEDQPASSRTNLSRIEISSIPINTSVKVRWIVKATSPTLLLEVDSRKGGVIQTRF